GRIIPGVCVEPSASLDSAEEARLCFWAAIRGWFSAANARHSASVSVLTGNSNVIAGADGRAIGSAAAPGWPTVTQIAARQLATGVRSVRDKKRYIPVILSESNGA